MKPTDQPVPDALGPSHVAQEFPDLLQDESRLVAGPAARVYRPRTAEEVARVVEAAAEERAPLCVSGARTGISGGAVPQENAWILSLERLDEILGAGIDPESGQGWVRVQAGVTLTQLAQWLSSDEAGELHGWIYPVDPTEWSASVGGTVATNASGGRSYRYGPTGAWVRALRLVLADGRLCTLRRGDVVARDGWMVWPDGWGDRRLSVPEVPHPVARCVAGYDLKDGGDLVDLIVGSEGTLAVVVEVELALVRAPQGLLALFVFLPPAVSGLACVAALRAESDLALLTAEFMDAESLRLLREFQQRGQGGDIPSFPADAGSALFLEFETTDEAGFERTLEVLDRVLSGMGASLDATWAGEDEAERQRMRHLRHAVPEAVNTWIRERARTVPGLHKVGTDLAVPDESAAALFAAYADVRARAGMRSVLFGHAAENHLHLNFLPENKDDLARAHELHVFLATETVRLGGAVTAEHGIGRLKRDLVAVQFGDRGVEALRTIKHFMDPDSILNRGVLLP